MPITKTEIDKIAGLAKLSFTDSEKKKLAKDLDQIIQYFDKLDELNLEQVELPLPEAHAAHTLREDKVEQGLSQQGALRNAPKTENGYFVVPKVIDLD